MDVYFTLFYMLPAAIVFIFVLVCKYIDSLEGKSTGFEELELYISLAPFVNLVISFFIVVALALGIILSPYLLIKLFLDKYKVKLKRSS